MPPLVAFQMKLESKIWLIGKVGLLSNYRYVMFGMKRQAAGAC